VSARKSAAELPAPDGQVSSNRAAAWVHSCLGLPNGAKTLAIQLVRGGGAGASLSRLPPRRGSVLSSFCRLARSEGQSRDHALHANRKWAQDDSRRGPVAVGLARLLSHLTPLFRQSWYAITLVLLLRTGPGCGLRHCILTL
jgi:hypothetical protein